MIKQWVVLLSIILSMVGSIRSDQALIYKAGVSEKNSGIAVHVPTIKSKKSPWQRLSCKPAWLAQGLISYLASSYGTEKLSESEKKQIKRILATFSCDIAPIKIKLRKFNQNSIKDQKNNDAFGFFNYLFLGPKFINNLSDESYCHAVLAHEIMHIQKNHTAKMYVIKPILALIPAMLAYMYSHNATNKEIVPASVLKRLAVALGKIGVVSTAAVMGIMLVHQYIKRQFEFEADEGFKKYLPDSAMAIDALASYSTGKHEYCSNQSEFMRWLNQCKKKYNAFFDSHPSIQDRIKMLEESAH